MNQNSPFRKRILEQGDSDIDYVNCITLIAFQCQFITEKFDEAQWKIATQAVEHELHCLVVQKPSILGTFFKLISDTEKTAPRHFSQRDIAREMAHIMLSRVAVELQG